MKLSELLKNPIKLKGGGVLDLRGFSKRVLDKELESTNKEEEPKEESEVES